MAPYLSRGPGFKTQLRGRLSSQQMVVYPTNRMGVVGAIHIDLKQRDKNVFSQKRKLCLRRDKWLANIQNELFVEQLGLLKTTRNYALDTWLMQSQFKRHDLVDVGRARVMSGIPHGDKKTPWSQVFLSEGGTTADHRSLPYAGEKRRTLSGV